MYNSCFRPICAYSHDAYIYILTHTLLCFYTCTHTHSLMLIIHTDCHGSPMLVEDYHPAGMEALEVLHNQLQILVSVIQL